MSDGYNKNRGSTDATHSIFFRMRKFTSTYSGADIELNKHNFLINFQIIDSTSIGQRK
jgi:hypothetical protein